MNEVKERPILFSSEMVRAILEGRKTMTRRVVKVKGLDLSEFHHAESIFNEKWHDTFPGADSGSWILQKEEGPLQDFGYICLPQPYGKLGDRLWVRECFSYSRHPPYQDIWFWVDGNPEYGDWEKPKPSIFMPRCASRIALEITSIRVERLQDISDADCEAEGVRPSVDGSGKDWRQDENGWHRTFRQLWDSINTKRGYGWDTNPWVWVVQFKKMGVAE